MNAPQPNKEDILFLTLKKKWYDLILSGVKKEEYREIKPYWISRLCKHYMEIRTLKHALPIPFKHVCFTNGYSKKSPRMLVKCEGITIGKGREDWGADI